MVADGPAGVATVIARVVQGEYCRVNSPVVWHAAEWAEKLPRVGVHGIRIGGAEKECSVRTVALLRVSSRDIDVPDAIEVV
jgi:hypothetical protein